MTSALIVFFLCGGGGYVATMLNRWFTHRQERLDASQAHSRRMEVLRAKQELTQKAADAIEILLVDREIGEDFNMRLRIALDKKKQAEEAEAEQAAEEAEAEHEAESSSSASAKMSARKRYQRTAFRNAVFARADYHCEGPSCLFRSSRERAEAELDAHHITNRNEMPGGGYVSTNGIALCPSCHEKAEQFHATGIPFPGYAPDELYTLIGSSRERAEHASRRAP